MTNVASRRSWSELDSASEDCTFDAHSQLRMLWCTCSSIYLYLLFTWARSTRVCGYVHIRVGVTRVRIKRVCVDLMRLGV